MSVKFPFFLGGGGSADFIFMGARIFLIFHNALSIALFLQCHRCDAPSLFFSIARSNFSHRTHRPSAFASIFSFRHLLVYCTKQQEICQESQRSDVATGNARWPSQTQTQTQRCGALSESPRVLRGLSDRHRI